MRILQVVQKPQRRGAEVFAYQLTNGFQRSGNDVRIVYLYPYSGPMALPLGAEDLVLDGRYEHFLEAFPGWHPKLVRDLRRNIHEFEPDIVQVNGARTVKYGALISRLNQDSRWALIYRNIGDPKEWVRGTLREIFYRRFIIPRVHGIVAVSNGALKVLKEFYKPVVPMVVIPTGFDNSALIPSKTRNKVREGFSTKNDCPVLIFVGSLTPEKRLDRLLRVVQKTRMDVPDVTVWMVGDGPLRAQLESESKNLGMESAVRFVGVQQDIASILTAADIFVMTSDTEGIPASVLEAGYCGLPAVATRVGSIQECVRDGETGFLVDPQEEEKFSAIVVRLLRSQEERNKIGIQAKKWITENFAMDQIVQKYLDFYRSVRSADKN
jgi:glycosyltransferase involved in cell wall biosynthesis